MIEWDFPDAYGGNLRLIERNSLPNHRYSVTVLIRQHTQRDVIEDTQEAPNKYHRVRRQSADLLLVALLDARRCTLGL